MTANRALRRATERVREMNRRRQRERRGRLADDLQAAEEAGYEMRVALLRIAECDSLDEAKALARTAASWGEA